VDDDEQLVCPDGLSVRRLRHAHRWSPRELVQAIARASLRESGLPDTITPKELSGIEEKDSKIPYATLRRLAAGLDCDPVDILRDESVPREPGGEPR